MNNTLIEIVFTFFFSNIIHWKNKIMKELFCIKNTKGKNKIYIEPSCGEIFDLMQLIATFRVHSIVLSTRKFRFQRTTNISEFCI